MFLVLQVALLLLLHAARPKHFLIETENETKIQGQSNLTELEGQYLDVESLDGLDVMGRSSTFLKDWDRDAVVPGERGCNELELLIREEREKENPDLDGLDCDCIMRSTARAHVTDMLMRFRYRYGYKGVPSLTKTQKREIKKLRKKCPYKAKDQHGKFNDWLGGLLYKINNQKPCCYVTRNAKVKKRRSILQEKNENCMLNAPRNVHKPRKGGSRRGEDSSQRDGYEIGAIWRKSSGITPDLAIRKWREMKDLDFSTGMVSYDRITDPQVKTVGCSWAKRWAFCWFSRELNSNPSCDGFGGDNGWFWNQPLPPN